MELVLIHEKDNVRVSPENGHKYAARAIKQGEPVVKYGFPIGTAAADIAPGDHVHTHNLRTALTGTQDYTYTPAFAPLPPLTPRMIQAYVRADGRVGVRNDVWIVPTVGCVNELARKLSALTGAFAFPHPYGCSQLGGDHLRTQQTLCGLIRHPNAGGVLVLGLGCENNRIPELKKAALIRYYRTHEVTDAPGNAAFLREHDLPEILANTALWGTDLSDLLAPLEEAYAIEDIREAIAWSLC